MPDDQQDNQAPQEPQDAQSPQDPQNPQDAPQKEQAEGPEQAPSVKATVQSQKADTINMFTANEIHVGVKTLGELFQVTQGHGRLSAESNEFSQAFGQAFSSAWSSSVRGIFPRGLQAAYTPSPRPEKMPETPEAIETWFCSTLSPHERCFVRATAILHGAPARAITIASQQLYEEFHVSRAAINVQGISETGNNDGTPNRPMVDNAFLDIRVDKGVRRLYWQSPDFGLNMLRLIAREIEGTGGMRGQNSERLIKRWATYDDIETAWRAAHALGVIWWETDQNHLEHTISAWARSEKFAETISAAGVIFGAYEAETQEFRAKETNPSKETQAHATPSTEMKTLRLLRRLANEARATTSESRAWSLARMVATSCQLFAIVTPEIAFDELDHFLGLEYDGEEASDPSKLPLAAFLYGTQAYLTCAWNGQVRLVLSHLAKHADRLTRRLSAAQKAHPLQSEVVARYERALAIILFIVFFLATSSFAKSAAKAYITDAHDARLQPEPEIPDPAGKDILLAGILFDGEQPMREAMRTLFCAALLSSQATLVSEVLERWASQLFPETPTNEQEEGIWRTYRRFVESVGRMVGHWDVEMGRDGARSGIARFRGPLLRWPVKKVSSQIATEALDRLGLATL